MDQPSSEQERREMFRRVRIGLAGLAGVLLLVGLSEFVVDNIRKEAALHPPEAAPVAGTTAPNAASAVQGSEPLADLGVTPAPDARTGPVLPELPAVPDLEPDPRLQKRMDRDPREPGEPSP